MVACKSSHFDTTYDVVVVGSGGAALVAAVTAAKKHGLSVLVTEKSRWFGGTTAFSGGGAWIPANHLQPSLGFSDSKEKAEKYIRGMMGELYDERTVASFLENAPKMAKWLEDETALGWTGVPMVDFYSSAEGAVPGRMLLPKSFDGRKLGRTVQDIRYTLQGWKAFDSMQVSAEEIPMMTHPFASLGSFIHVVSKLLRYWRDRIRHGKGTFLANGNAMIGSLIYTLQQVKGELWNNSPATKIIMDGGRATGIVIDRKAQGSVRVRASKGIVLASGGFGRAGQAHLYGPREYCMSPASNLGDGIRIATDVGGTLSKPIADSALYVPISTYRPKTGPVRLFPHFGQDRSKPGSIIVDVHGKRFINESEGYHQFGQEMRALSMDHCYCIVDRRFLRKYGLGFQLPAPYLLSRTLSQRYWVSAPTIPELAKKLHLPVDNLTATVRRFNKYAIKGEDPDFHRGERLWDNMFGDLENKPNPNLRPCDQAPFYAVKLYPGNASTLHGLETNEYAQVLDKAGSPVPGLYASGNDNNSIWRGTYPGGGSSIGPGTVFGYVAANQIASQ
ncbi:hypothetical protein H2204_013994 [Knufia peltigerae]|uniref:FAD-dependent oxidoreductase 2 FAD-binding domain-containing protein n=1 Tax=Knufia peltigerae TaxID=1002370 RepID=A0AA38XNI5_9EURO|nr:hypothetical protein H2204_013994 [Knufia peltigerae]